MTSRVRTLGALVGALVVGLIVSVPGVAAAAGGRQPDQLIRAGGRESSVTGDDVYSRDGRNQKVVQRLGAHGVGDFFIEIQNDGRLAATYRVRGSNHTAAFSVRYLVAGRDVSTSVKAGTYQTPELAPGEQQVLRVRLAPRSGTMRKGSAFTARVTTAVVGGDQVDVTRSRIERPLYTDEQLEVRDDINRTRAANHLNGLAMNRTLAAKAQAWAVHLADIGRLEHSTLTAGVPSGWAALGENVGYYTSLSGVHQQFLQSPGHRANILGRFTDVGTGVAHRGQWVYVVHVFML